MNKFVVQSVVCCLMLLMPPIAAWSADDSGDKCLRLLAQMDGAEDRLRYVRPAADADHYLAIGDDGASVVAYSFATGAAEEPLFDAATARNVKLTAIDGFEVSSNGFRMIIWCDEEVVEGGLSIAHYYDYDVRRNYLKPLSDEPGKCAAARFSPDGRMCAYIKDGDLWLRKFDFDTEVRVTADASQGKVYNGVPDALYHDHLGVREPMISWSMDSKLLAFVRLDDSSMSLFPQVSYMTTPYPQVAARPCAMAADALPQPSLHVYHIDTKDTKELPLPNAQADYLPRIAFSPYSDQLAVMTLSRNANLFQYHHYNARSMVHRLLFTERGAASLDLTIASTVVIEKSGIALLSYRDGGRHLVRHSFTGVALDAVVAQGDYSIERYYGMDDKGAYYYTSNEAHPTSCDLYRVDAKGRRTMLSEGVGSSYVVFGAQLRNYIEWRSSYDRPTVASRHQARSGKRYGIWYDNEALRTSLAPLASMTKEVFELDGGSLAGWAIVPQGAAAEGLPLLLVVNAGSGLQAARNRFDLGWEYYWAAQGYVVAMVDVHGTPMHPAEFSAYSQRSWGTAGVEDIRRVVAHLVATAAVDARRVALFGEGVGAAQVLMAMADAKPMAKLGVVVAPLTDWRLAPAPLANHVLTTPGENEAGFLASSPVEQCDRLSGKLLIFAPTADRCYGYHHTMRYAGALAAADKDYELRLLPDHDGRLTDLPTRSYLYRAVARYLDRAL